MRPVVPAMRDGAVARAGAAATARATCVDGSVNASDDVVGEDEASDSDSETRHRVVVRHHVHLPDEVVQRILQIVLESTAGKGAHVRWSVGGRFRVPLRRDRGRGSVSPEAFNATSRSNRTCSASSRTIREKSENTNEPFAVASYHPRGSLRLVSKQFKHVMDTQCATIEARSAVVFGDDALVGLANALAWTNEVKKLSLQGSHLAGGAFALTDAGLGNATNLLPSLTHLAIDRTGMNCGDVFRVASKMPHLKELQISGDGTSAWNKNANKTKKIYPERSSSTEYLVTESTTADRFDAALLTTTSFGNPFDAALLHAMPFREQFPGLEPFTGLFADGPKSLTGVEIRGVPDLFQNQLGSFAEGLMKSTLLEMCAALSSCTNLRELVLEDVGASDKIACAIANALPQTLEVFTIGGDEVGPRTGAAVGKALATDKNPALRLVRLPRAAAFGAVAVLELDRAFKNRAAQGRALCLRLNSGSQQDGIAMNGVAAVARKVLSRWAVTHDTEKEKQKHPSELTFSSENVTPSNSTRQEVTSPSTRNEDTESPTDSEVAKEVLAHLATHESAVFEGDKLDMTGWSPKLDMTGWSPQTVYAACGKGSSRSVLVTARGWFEKIAKEDSLKQTATRVAVCERFAALGLLLETSSSSCPSSFEELGRVRTKDDAAFARVALDIEKFKTNLSIGFGELQNSPLPRALASAALPVALFLAAIADDASCGRGGEGSPIPNLPDAIIDRVHAELCIFLVAVDLFREDVACRNNTNTNTTHGDGFIASNRVIHETSNNKGDPFLSDACYANGGGWALLEVTRRYLEGDGDKIVARAIEPAFSRFQSTHGNGNHPPGKDFSVSEILSCQMLPRWIAGGLQGSSTDAAVAADCAALALKRLASHTVSLEIRELRQLALVLASAAMLLPTEGGGFQLSRCSLHDAVCKVFASREFKPLLRSSPFDNKRPYELGVLSWPQWLHAVGAPPPMAVSVATATASNLLAKEIQFLKLEAELASVKAKMDRLAHECRVLSADLRLSTQFHREPARALLLQAHRACGWAAVDGEPMRLPRSLGYTASRARQTGLWGRPCVGHRPSRIAETYRSNFSTTRKTRAPVDGWREKTIALLDQLFRHCEASAPFVAVTSNEHDDQGGTKGYAKVNDAQDTSCVFHTQWERRAAAAMLAWYVDTVGTVDVPTVDKSLSTVDVPAVDKSLSTVDVPTVDTSLSTVDVPTVDKSLGTSHDQLANVLRVLGVRDGTNEREIRSALHDAERLPVGAMLRLRREATGTRVGVSARSGPRSFEREVTLDKSARWNLLLDDEGE